VTHYEHPTTYDSRTNAWMAPDFVILRLEQTEGTVDTNYVNPIRITQLDAPTKNCWIVGKFVVIFSKF
jgi:hypothetical protein